MGARLLEAVQDGYYWEQAPDYRTWDGSVYGEPDPDMLAALAAPREDGPVLQIGAGDGRDTIPLHRQGQDVVATDYDRRTLRFLRRKARIEDLRDAASLALDTTMSPSQIAEAFRDRPRIRTRQLDAFQQFPFANGTFGTVEANALLYAYPEELIQPVVREAHRVLRDEGVSTGNGKGRLVFDFLTDRETIPYATGIAERSRNEYTLDHGLTVIHSVLERGGFTEPTIKQKQVDADRPRLGHRLRATKLIVSTQKR